MAQLEDLQLKLDKALKGLKFYRDASYEGSLEDRLGYFDSEEWIYNEAEIIEDGGATAKAIIEEIEE